MNVAISIFRALKKANSDYHVYRDLSMGSAVRINFPLPPSTILSCKSLRLNAYPVCDSTDQHGHIIKFLFKPRIPTTGTSQPCYAQYHSPSLPRMEDAHQMHDTCCWVDGQTYLRYIAPRGIMSLYFSNRCVCIPFKMITVAA